MKKRKTGKASTEDESNPFIYKYSGVIFHKRFALFNTIIKIGPIQRKWKRGIALLPLLEKGGKQSFKSCR